MTAPEPRAGGGSPLRRLFDRAAEATAAEREEILAALGGEDPRLAAELAALLAAHDRAGDFLEEGPVPPPPEPSPAHPQRLVGERLGDYRIVRPLGRGGMGAVFVAERADGAYRQTVAIKLLDHLDPDAGAVRRFERERQTLARLAHPNVARLLDGGTTADGTPFLVMEYVDGEHLDEHCERRGLDVPARLRLFLQVCAGVEHAHRHLVVHRDLKPSNVLVTRDGEVKLLDFGIARLLGDLEREGGGGPAGDGEAAPRSLAGAATLTAGGPLAFTPGYASPEQLRGEPVSAASDVYALGLVLHELLTGARPQGESRPPVDPSRLPRRRRGDLAAILARALDEDAARRYPTAGALGDDLERHLDHRPVAARAGERAYVAGRFVRRHRLAVAAALLVLLSLVGGLAAATWQARRAEAAQAVAEERFDQVQELARSLLFDVHDAVAPLPGATPARHLLVERALVYLDGLRAEAAGDAALQRELADAYERIGDIQGNPQQSNLGDTVAAEASYRTALALRLGQPEAARERPELRAAVARTHHRLGDVLWWTGDVGEAARQLERAIAGWQGLAADQPGEPRWRLEEARSLTSLATVLSWNGDHAAALARAAAAEALLAPLVAGADAEDDAAAEALALVHQVRGETLGWMGEIDAGLAALDGARDALARLAAARPLDAPLRRRLYLVSLRRSSLLADRSLEEAAASFAATLELARELAAADPANARAQRDLSLAHASFGDVLSEVGRKDEALDHFRRAQAIQRRLAAEDPNNLGHQADLANSAVRIGYLLQEEGEHAAALDGFGDALDRRLGLAAADPDDAANRRDVAVIESARADSLAALGRRGAACDAYRDSLGLWRELDGAGLLREYDRPELEHAAAGVAASCGGVSAR